MLEKKFYNWPPDQILRVLQKTMHSLGVEQIDTGGVTNEHKIGINVLKTMRILKSKRHLPTANFKLGLAALSLEKLQGMPARSIESDFGIKFSKIERIKKIRENLFGGETSFLKLNKTKYSSKWLGLYSAISKFLDDESVPEKFRRKKDARILNNSVPRLRRLYLKTHSADIKKLSPNGTCSFYHFKKGRLPRHLSHRTATFYNCEDHVLAQYALDDFRRSLNQLHPPVRCDVETCSKCAFIQWVPETVHDFVNWKLANCDPRNPCLKCVTNVSECCELDDNFLLVRASESGFKFKLTSKSFTYTSYESEVGGSHTYENLVFKKDKTNKDVLLHWGKTMIDVVHHQICVWKFDKFIPKYTSLKRPLLPRKSVMVFLDYQENLELTFQHMTQKTKFKQKKLSPLTVVTDFHVDDLMKLEPPSKLDKDDFQNHFVRITRYLHCRNNQARSVNCYSRLEESHRFPHNHS